MFNFQSQLTHTRLTERAAGKGYRPGLRVKRVRGTGSVWEMTFAPDGRATFEYGDELIPGQPHII
jgi:hypothetical protein